MVTLRTLKFEAVAQCSEDGEVTCVVTSRPEVHSLLGWMETARKVAGQCAMGLFGILWMAMAAHLRPDVVQLAYWGVAQFLIYAFLAYSILIDAKAYRTWHAAEHQATDAYTRFGLTNIEAVAAGNRFQLACGGSWVIVGLAVEMVASLALVLLRFDALSATILGIWFALLVTKYVVRRAMKVRPFVWASRMLQLHLTTAPPGQDELRTAQAALQALADAHADIEVDAKVEVMA